MSSAADFVAFYRSRCNCSCLLLLRFGNYKRDWILGDRLDSEQVRGGNRPNQLNEFVYNVHKRRSRDTV